jgi:hypothetical protein
MKIGDKVTWKSQSHGSWKQKTGEIIAFVRPNEPVGRAIDRLSGDYNTTAINTHGVRDWTSYLVAVGSKLYWPRVSGLEVGG